MLQCTTLKRRDATRLHLRVLATKHQSRRENTWGLSKTLGMPQKNGTTMLFELGKLGSRPLDFGLLVMFPIFLQKATHCSIICSMTWLLELTQQTFLSFVRMLLSSVLQHLVLSSSLLITLQLQSSKHVKIKSTNKRWDLSFQHWHTRFCQDVYSKDIKRVYPTNECA